MSVMEKLKAEQQSAPVPVAAPELLNDGDDSAEPGHPDNPVFVQIASPVPTCPGGGYIKIFPPKFQSIADLTPEWIEANWSAPGPWCSVEGHAQHEEFEANLAGVEK